MRRLTLLASLACLLGIPGLATAAAGPQKDQFFVSLLGSYYDEPSGLDLRRGDAGPGGGIGWSFQDDWSVEALFFDLEPRYDVGGVRGTGGMEYWTINFIRHIGQSEIWQPYVTFGGGRARYSYDNVRSNTRDNLYNVGIGFFSPLNQRLLFRADVRGVYHNDADSISPMATVGLSLLLNKPAAPLPAPAPAAPEEPIDSDGDGVPDYRDRCPGTPPGVAVDEHGCPLDSDGDGVPDYRDDCPDTPPGARVDERGCEIVLDQPVSFNLTVEFAFDSAEITGVAFQEMLALLRFLREHPNTTAVIEGHTDSRGSAAYNQGLSERRAQAVMQALTNSGIAANRLTSRGYGETRPIASNDTDAGRAQNRRVTVVVSGPGGG
jgi:OmpA-OmpF porin, OOP family